MTTGSWHENEPTASRWLVWSPKAPRRPVTILWLDEMVELATVPGRTNGRARSTFHTMPRLPQRSRVTRLRNANRAIAIGVADDAVRQALSAENAASAPGQPGPVAISTPLGIPASLVRPHEKVISISGDGGFLFSSMELETAVRPTAHVVPMIWIDGTYDMVAYQEILEIWSSLGMRFGPVDPVKYPSAPVRPDDDLTADEIGSILAKAMATSGPVISSGWHVDYTDNRRLFGAGRHQQHPLSAVAPSPWRGTRCRQQVEPSRSLSRSS